MTTDPHRHRRRACCRSRRAGRRPGAGQHGEVLRRLEGRQERLPDGGFVVRRHVQEGRQADAWISVPKGTCDKIIGGKLTAELIA